MKPLLLALLLLAAVPARAGDLATLSGKNGHYALHLADAAGMPLTPERLQTLHAQKLHLLVVDAGMKDYQHLHPEPVKKEPGAYAFAFQPKTKHDYTIWADFAPAGRAEEYIRVPFKGTEACAAPCVDETPALAADAEGFHAELSMEDDMWMLSVSGPAPLEPVMGAMAHIAAFPADGGSLLHIHPLEDEDGAPGELTFHMDAPAKGTVKLFAQVRAAGKDVYFPFTLKPSP